MEKPFVKICGITNLEDALVAVEHGATALGFNFFEKSKRFIEPANAAKIIQQLPHGIMNVGVFVNADATHIQSVIQQTHITTIQLHGDESPEFVSQFSNDVIKAFRVKESFDAAMLQTYSSKYFLLDAFDEKEFGGTGKTFNWQQAREAKQFGNIIIAGGLTSFNVCNAIKIAQPFGVDVSSGVERTAGKKDSKKVQEFIVQAQQAFHDLTGC